MTAAVVVLDDDNDASVAFGCGEGGIGSWKDGDCGLVSMGLDRGDKVVSLLLGSEAPRGGILTSLASFFEIGVL